MTYNEQQKAVIEAAGGHHLVLAPPGCGKTAVLAERIVWANAHGMPFEEMACLTFTNRASRGMRERIYGRLPDASGLDRLFVGNVHRFCSRFLFETGVVPQHTAVIDTDTSISIMADFLGEDELRVLAENRQRQRYSQTINLQHLMYQCVHHHPSALMVHRDAMPPALLRELCLAFSLPYTQDSVIELYVHAEHYRDEHVLLSSDAGHLLQALCVARQYEDYKRQNDLLDFEDLLLMTYEATADPQARQHRLKWLQVDEVQDLNPLQLAIIDLFTAHDATVVYLGDAQQAIFSFMGAQTDTLTMLRHRCGEGHFHNFHQNYRSPGYLLNVFNTYAASQLGIEASLLPSTHNTTPQQAGDLLLMDSPTTADEAVMVASEVKRICDSRPPEETVAVIVAFNSDADEVSNVLGSLPHFKISGTDFFSTPAMRLLLAHLSVLSTEQNFIAWSHLFSGLRLFSSNSASRQFVRALMGLALSPVDFLDYDHSTYMAEFVKAYEQQDFVVFDTETTGLDIFEDDVVQIAALKVRKGRVVDRLNLFVETSREIPAMLGDVVNPLIAEYGRHRHLSHRDALQCFVDFARGCAILGHNATYDYHIMESQMRRYAPELSMTALWPDFFDTLKLARLLHPRQKSYKLKHLLQQLGLEGENSHLADDDVLATLSLMVYCYDRARSMVGRQLQFVSHHRSVISRFRHLYSDLFAHARSRLYQSATGPVLSEEMRYAYDYLREMGRMDVLPKLPYVLQYVEQDLLAVHPGCSLADQLSRHVQDLCTMKEADLCGSASMTERVFVSTVHKAKGLEFDHVLVYDAVDGKFPSVFSNTREHAEEEARKFYVAISRARRSLMVTYSHQSVTPWGRTYPRTLTPYMSAVQHLFCTL